LCALPAISLLEQPLAEMSTRQARLQAKELDQFVCV
jgi:hypothetical protein